MYLQFIYYEAMADLWYPKAPGGNLATALMNGTAKWTDPAFIQGMTEEKADRPVPGAELHRRAVAGPSPR